MVSFTLHGGTRLVVILAVSVFLLPVAAHAQSVAGVVRDASGRGETTHPRRDSAYRAQMETTGSFGIHGVVRRDAADCAANG
jgi:hypothetical protein